MGQPQKTVDGNGTTRDGANAGPTGKRGDRDAADDFAHARDDIERAIPPALLRRRRRLQHFLQLVALLPDRIKIFISLIEREIRRRHIHRELFAHRHRLRLSGIPQKLRTLDISIRLGAHELGKPGVQIIQDLFPIALLRIRRPDRKITHVAISLHDVEVLPGQPKNAFFRIIQRPLFLDRAQLDIAPLGLGLLHQQAAQVALAILRGRNLLPPDFRLVLRATGIADEAEIDLEIMFAALSGGDGGPDRYLGLVQPLAPVRRLQNRPVRELSLLSLSSAGPSGTTRTWPNSAAMPKWPR